MDDIDDGFPGIEEHHRIQRGHINPFGQTAGIGEDAAFPRVTLTLEPVQGALTDQRIHGAVHMIQPTVHHGRGTIAIMVGLIQLDDLGEQLRGLLGVFDGFREGHRPPHGGGIFGQLLLTHFIDQDQSVFGQPFPTTNDLGGKADVDSLFVVNLVRIEVIDQLRHLAFAHRDDQHLVFGKEVHLDRFTET